MEEGLEAPARPPDEIIKHWLLNLAIEFPVPLTTLFPGLVKQRFNARPVPNCSVEDYARNLLGLFDSGMIVFFSELPQDDTTTRPGASRILDRFLSLPRGYKHEPFNRLSPMMRVHFSLTALGGESWERVAEPDWARFFLERSDYLVADFLSSNREFLVAYMGWYSDLNDARILTETVNWKTHSDFEILYWKRLPLVHHAFCRVEVKEPPTTPQWLRDWYFSAISWHKHPWETPGWPKD